jgi:hypothetical protein
LIASPTVWLATTTTTGACLSSGSITPCAAPPRAHEQHGLRGGAEAQPLADVPDKRGTVGVVAQDRFAVELEPLTAPARAARSVRSVASAKASSLKGAMTFRPLPPAVRKAATAAAKAVARGEHRVVSEILLELPVEFGMNARRLVCAIGLPITAYRSVLVAPDLTHSGPSAQVRRIANSPRANLTPDGPGAMRPFIAALPRGIRHHRQGD